MSSETTPGPARSGSVTGPTLPELIGVRRARIVLAVLVVPLVLLGLAYAFLRGGGDAKRFARTAPPAFNLRHSPVLKELAPKDDGLLLLEGSRKGLFLQSMAVRPLHLPRYAGSVSGVLPAYATKYRIGLARRYDGFSSLEEGKVRINGNPGYAIGFRARLGQRTLWGREVLLLPDMPAAREGIVITLLQTPAAGAHSVDDVGSVGALKKPYRSLRFGTATGGNQ